MSEVITDLIEKFQEITINSPVTSPIIKITSDICTQIKRKKPKIINSDVYICEKKDDVNICEKKDDVNICKKNNDYNNIMSYTKYDIILDKISKSNNNKIVLLRNRQVIQWLFSDLSFLPDIQKKNKTNDIELYKKEEDKWGRSVLKTRRPDLKLDKQWTNKFGEHICEELYMLLGNKISKPKKQEHFQPDLETEHAIIEAKAQTFYTTGTAGEKILGVPVKYANIPILYSKPLYILCMGGAEKLSREQYGNLPGPQCNDNRKKLMDMYKSIGIHYIGATDILLDLIGN